MSELANLSNYVLAFVTNYYAVYIDNSHLR